jgi:hypothetical protein
VLDQGQLLSLSLPAALTAPAEWEAVQLKAETIFFFKHWFHHQTG